MLSGLVSAAVGQAEKVASGGEPYFDALDASLYTDPLILDALLTHITTNHAECNMLILSGHFGAAFVERHYKWMATSGYGYLLLTGGMRVGKPPELKSYLRTNVQKALIVDDSAYSYGTLRTMRAEAFWRGFSADKALVLYDGGKRDNLGGLHLESFYQYYKTETTH